MARLIGDGFDMYAATTDAALGRWSASSGIQIVAAANTAFSVGQAFRFGFLGLGSLTATFETATNETTIFFSLRFRNNCTTSAQTISVQFRDGTNVQCSVTFCGDNAIRVYSGTNAGTLLTTLVSAYSSATWDSYQGKIVVNNTTGSVEVRKNGATTPIINLSGVNTRAGSTNAYANQLNITTPSVSSASFDIDDIWLNSDNGAAPTTWPGDVRCVTSMIAAVSGSAAFSPSPASVSVTPFTQIAALAHAAGAAIYTAFTASYTGTVATASVAVTTGGTGNMKAAIYDSTRQTVLATSNAVVNPITGTNTFTFASPPTLTKGTVYYFAIDQDATFSYGTGSGTIQYSSTTAYASFPATAPTTSSGTGPDVISVVINPTNNAELVSDATQDGDTTGVYSSTVSAEDKYTLTALTVTPASILGVCPFVMWKKSDSGARTANLSVTANGSADTAEVSGVTPSLSYGYNQKFLPLDPTGAAWTTANVNGALLGITVAS